MINTQSLTQEERFELVMECRSSGLSNYQWCQKNGIRPGTFYNWIARFRKIGYPNIPESTGRTSKHKAVKLEVVKLDVLPDAPADTTAFQSGGFTFGSGHTGTSTIEIHTGSSVILMTNDIDPQLFCMVFSKLGGM